MSILIIVKTILELVTMDSLVLAVMNIGCVWVDLSPLAWILELGVVGVLAAGQLNWLIV